MPSAAPKPCTQCGKLVHGGGSRCELHRVASWSQKRTTPAKRITGRKLQRMREELFASEPLCRPCRAKGRLTVATLRDHVIPLGEGGEDVRENTQPICADCHEEKTLAEALRGRGGSKV